MTQSGKGMRTVIVPRGSDNEGEDPLGHPTHSTKEPDSGAATPQMAHRIARRGRVAPPRTAVESPRV